MAFSTPIIMLGQAEPTLIESTKPHKTSRVERMAQDLDLTEDQKVQLKEIHKSYKPRIEEARSIEDEVQRKAVVREIRAEEKSAINAQLTPEQQAKFKDYHKKKKKHSKMNKMQPKQ